MGILQRLMDAFGLGREKVSILVVGLDNSGKTTILNQLKPKKLQKATVVPTVGFHVESFTRNTINFTAFDMSGQGRYRDLWQHYFREAQAVIFVVDTTDSLRMCVAKDELDVLLKHAELRRVPILFFANKMDVPKALTTTQCVQALQLDDIKEKPWHIVGSNAVTGEGVEAGFNWLADVLKR